MKTAGIIILVVVIVFLLAYGVYYLLNKFGILQKIKDSRRNYNHNTFKRERSSLWNRRQNKITLNVGKSSVPERVEVNESQLENTVRTDEQVEPILEEERFEDMDDYLNELEYDEGEHNPNKDLLDTLMPKESSSDSDNDNKNFINDKFDLNSFLKSMNDESDLLGEIENLSPELKAAMLTGLFDKKF